MESPWSHSQSAQGQLWSEEICTESRKPGENQVTHRVGQQEVRQKARFCF